MHTSLLMFFQMTRRSITLWPCLHPKIAVLAFNATRIHKIVYNILFFLNFSVSFFVAFHILYKGSTQQYEGFSCYTIIWRSNQIRTTQNVIYTVYGIPYVHSVHINCKSVESSIYITLDSGTNIRRLQQLKMEIVLGLFLSLFVVSNSLIVPPIGQHSTDDVYAMLQQFNATLIQYNAVRIHQNAELNTTLTRQNAVLMHQNAELNTTLAQMTANVTLQDASLSKLNSLFQQQNAKLTQQDATISKLKSMLSQQNSTFVKQAAIIKQQSAAIQSLLRKEGMYFMCYSFTSIIFSVEWSVGKWIIAPGLTSALQGSVNVHRGTLLLVPQWQCMSSFVFYIEIDHGSRLLYS